MVKEVKKMADPCQPCSYIPYTSQCYCPPQKGISVMQPKCQMLSSGNTSNNPCYDAALNISSWTYKFFTDCTADNSVSPISSFLIPIYINILQPNITVDERIDGMGQFIPVQFMLGTDDADFGIAPQDFQWLKVANTGRYGKGAFVEYRIRILGDFPTIAMPISVKAGFNNLTFTHSGGYFKVPGSPLPGELNIMKSCEVVIENNTASLQYNFFVMNTGAGVLNNVQYNDVITYDSASLAIGQMEAEPKCFKVKSITPGIITVFGNLGTINPGESMPVNYTMPVLSIAWPNEYIIANAVTLTSEELTLLDTSNLVLDAVQLFANKCYIAAKGNAGTFKMTVSNVGLSPQTRISLNGQIIIPADLVVNFTDFDGCTAQLQDGSTIPLTVNVTNAAINISCSSALVPSGGSLQKNIQFMLVSTSSFQSHAMITGKLQQVDFLNNASQVFLGISNIPTSASVDIISAVTCNES